MDLRAVFLQRLKNYGASAAFAFVVWYYLRQKSFKKTISQRKEEGYKIIPVAGTTTNSFLYSLIGHAAELKPWTFKDIGVLGFEMLDRRFHWYKAVKNIAESLPSVHVKMVKKKYLFTRDLGLVQAIIGNEDKLFRNSDTIRNSWGILFPKSVTIMTGKDWKRVRRVLVSAVNKLNLEQLPSSSNEVLERGVPNLITDDVMEVNIWNFFSSITFDSFIKFAFRTEFDTMSGKDMWLMNMLRGLTKKVCDRMFIDFPWLWYLPFGTTPALFKVRDQLISFIENDVMQPRIKLYKENPEEFRKVASNSMVDALILASEEAKSGKREISHEEVAVQLVAVMFGGFDTTTSSLSFLYLSLCKEPQYQEMLLEEIKDVDLKTVTKTELDNFPYLNSIIKESQRLHAVAGLVVRVPNEDVVIKDTFIAKDTVVFVDSESLGQNPEYWKQDQDLKEFRPERWFNFEPKPGVFSPFGFGGRKCPGYRIAHVQLQTILCYLTQNYQIEFSDKDIQKRCSLGLTVSEKATLIIKKRK